VPVLGAVALARVAHGRWRARLARPAAITAAVALLLYNGLTHVAFVREAAALPWRPVDAVIPAMADLGIQSCYAASRIAQVIAFESGERIICADYYGLRNFEFLEAVDAVEDPTKVAVVTHRVAEGPAPAVMKRVLHLIGARVEQTVAGDFVVFHHARP